jgi:hypothetical protein
MLFITKLKNETQAIFSFDLPLFLRPGWGFFSSTNRTNKRSSYLHPENHKDQLPLKDTSTGLYTGNGVNLFLSINPGYLQLAYCWQ